MIRALALAAFAVLALSTQAALAGPASEAQGLWVANADYMSEFQGSALESSGTPDAHLAFGTKPPFRVPYSIAFDRHNDLWITNLGGFRAGDVAIIEVLNDEIRSIESGDVATRRRVIPSGPGIATKYWLSLGFDTAGDLFVTAMGQLLGIPRHQLERHRPAPAVVISSTQWSPQVIRFDASDDLWLSVDFQQLWKFTPGDRGASGAPNPSLKVVLPDGIGLQDFAFDSSGDLWIAGAIFPASGDMVNEIEMISAGDLVHTGDISPPASLTITSPAFGVDGAALSGGPCLGGIDFDHSGNLWVSAHCDPETHLLEFTPSQSSAGGNLEPTVTISPNSNRTNLAFPGPIRFGPTVN